MTPPDLPPPPPSRLGKPTSSFSRPTGRWNPPTVTNYVMETEDLFVPLDARQVWVKSSTVVSRKKWVPSSSDLELLSLNRLKQQQACEDNCKAAVKDVSWRKKWVAVWMDVVSRKWVACTGLFIVLMLVMAAIPHDEDYHDFADQRTLFLGIPNTLNVISTIPLFFVGLAGLILNHCKSYFRLCSQGDLYTLFFSGVIAAGFGSSCHHLNPKNGTLFLHTLPMVTAFTSFEAIFIIESFDDWARTKSLASTSYWLWAAGLYVLARVEEVADKQIYRWTLQIVSGHTLGHLCASMVPLFLILMLAKRTRLIEEERHMIPVHHQLKLTIMVCLLVPKMICLWVPKIQVSVTICEISLLMWQFGARSVNQAKLSDETAMLETPIRAWESVSRFFMRYLGLVLLGLMGGCQNELPPTQLTDHVVALNQVSVTICEISLLMWQFGARSVNQAKLSDETAMLETPIRAWESVSRFFMRYLGLVLLGLMGGCQNELPPTQLTDHVVALNQVSVTICEISLLMWQFGARSVNQAKLSDETAMLETPIRAWESVSRIHGLWGMDIYKNKVLQFLQSERSDDSFFGLWGVRGVGKTRLLSLIAASYADSFRHILFLDGGSSVMAMQYHLASFLDLDWEKMSSLDEHSRAKTITEYLVQDSFLLLLDNVPYIPYPDLVAVGLPVPLGCRQKVVLASRSQRMCGLMGCTISNIVQMKCLGDEDAWRLFKYHVGVEITEADAEIYDYAKKMVWACGGLPRGILALGKGVARVTYSGKGLFTWQFAYNQTMGRIRHPEEMPEIAYVLI